MKCNGSCRHGFVGETKRLKFSKRKDNISVVFLLQDWKHQNCGNPGTGANQNWEWQKLCVTQNTD